MMTETFLYDTYALMELFNKNLNYEKYANEEVIINEFIFAEISYQLIKGNEENLNEYLSEIEPAIVNPSSEIIIKAMKFRYKNKKKKMSATDCISYIMAKELGIKFLTGDKEFEALEFPEIILTSSLENSALAEFNPEASIINESGVELNVHESATIKQSSIASTKSLGNICICDKNSSFGGSLSSDSISIKASWKVLFTLSKISIFKVLS